MANTIVKQEKVYGPRMIAGWGKNAQIKATVRFDDRCKNGHNTFSITAEIYVPGRRDVEACGCLHEEVARVFPQLAPFIKWHLVSSDEPMHYVANTLYWLGYSGWCDGKPDSPPNLKHARSTAVWEDMPDSYLAGGSGEHTKASVTIALEARRARLIQEFRAAVESLGLEWEACAEVQS